MIKTVTLQEISAGVTYSGASKSNKPTFFPKSTSGKNVRAGSPPDDPNPSKATTKLCCCTLS